MMIACSKIKVGQILDATEYVNAWDDPELQTQFEQKHFDNYLIVLRVFSDGYDVTVKTNHGELTFDANDEIKRVHGNTYKSYLKRNPEFDF